jgi:23S rRNA (uracil1939-C5)-methyltransferase
MIKSPDVQIGKTYELEVLRLSTGGGRGVGKIEGLVVFTPHTAPGERVRVRLLKLKKNYAEAELVEVLSPSPERIEPPCPVFEDCGGCSLQMLKISEQHRQKEGFLKHTVQRVFGDSGYEVESIQGSKKAFRYRNRIQLHQEGRALGFYKKGSHSLVRIDDCLITDERITKIFPDLKKQGRKRRLELAVTTGGQVVKSEQKLGPEEALFSQVNTEVNKTLVAYVVEKMKKLSGLENIYDLYCGAGNFSFPLASAFPDSSIVGVELSKRSVEEAKIKNQNANLSFVAKDVAKFLNKVESADFVLLDPPRKGLSKEVVESLNLLKPKHIFYVSCDLGSAGRDLQLLSQHYALKKAKPFDMFPQTDHLESFYHLELKSETE